MDRRHFLSLLGVGGVTGIAGCSSNETSPGGSQQADESSATPTTTDTPSETPTATPEPASFEVVEYTIPETVEIGEEFQFEITVRNNGEQSGDYTAPLYVRTPDSDWQEGGDWSFKGVAAGETATSTSVSGITFDYIQRYEFRLGQSQKTAVLQTVSSKVPWEEEYQTPEGYRIRVDIPNLQNTYKYKNYLDEVEEKAPEGGGQWVFVNVWVKNETGVTAYSPLTSDFSLLYGSTQADGKTFVVDEPMGKGEQFEGGELQPGVERSGWILYQVDSDVKLNDLEMAWSEQTFNGQIAARWGIYSSN